MAILMILMLMLPLIHEVNKVTDNSCHSQQPFLFCIDHCVSVLPKEVLLKYISNPLQQHIPLRTNMVYYTKILLLFIVLSYNSI